MKIPDKKIDELARKYLTYEVGSDDERSYWYEPHYWGDIEDLKRFVEAVIKETQSSAN